MWILKSAKNDLLWIVAPGILAILFTYIAPKQGLFAEIYAFVALGLIDSGHTYTTALRTWLHPEERRSNSLYWKVPLGILLVTMLWVVLHLPGLWMFVVYFGIFHSIRQYYGFHRWYERLNKRADSISRSFLYLLCLLPFLSRHFHQKSVGGFYSKTDILYLPSTQFYKLTVVLYAIVVWSWVVYELYLWLKGTHEWNRILSVLLPAIIFGHIFLLISSASDFVFPLLFSHGIAYIAVMTNAVPKVTPWLRNKFHLSLVIIIGLVVICGIIQFILEDYFELRASFTESISAGWGQGVVASIYLVPLLSHYIFDGFLWTRNHRESALIYT